MGREPRAMNNMPKEFWVGLTEEDWKSVFDTGGLNAKLCKRLWAMQGRTDPPPKRLKIMVDGNRLKQLLEKH
jgi:hypothetical protein